MFQLNQTLFLYADDASAIDHTRNNIDQKTKEQKCLEDMYDWFCSNLLSINSKKMGCVIFHTYNEIVKMDVNITGIQLKKLNQIKFLGMNLIENLKWKAQCDSIFKKLN